MLPSFLRKKDKDEKKKKEKGEAESSGASNKLTAEELIRLEEAKAAMQKKQGLDSTSPTQKMAKPVKPGLMPHSDSKRAPPVVQPKPPKKGILKDKSNYGEEIPNQGVRGSLDDTVTVEENTLANEILSGQEVDDSRPPDVKNIISSFNRASSITGSSKATPAKRTKSNLSGSSSFKSSPRSSVSKEPPSMPPPPPPRPPSPSDKIYDDVDLHLPDVSVPFCPKPREIILKRQITGDFGFTLRKGAILERGPDGKSENRRVVIFAEPGVTKASGSSTGLLPGDRLVEVNDNNVESVTREAVIELIKASGDSVRLLVQPIPELSELSMRSGQDGQVVSIQDHSVGSGTLQRSGSMKFKQSLAKSEEQMAAEMAWMSAEKVWLVHKGGFASARVLKGDSAEAGGVGGVEEGKCRVKLEHGGEVLTVEEEDVEKSNPPQFDRVEDLSSLRYLNESSVLHTVRQRYGSNLIHTYAGRTIVVLNPMHALSIYSDKVVQMFRGCKPEDMPPHIFATAQTAYRNMLNTRRDQSIVLLGPSGAGKTSNARSVLNYYATAYGAVNDVLTVEKLNALFTLLDAFGNSRTVMNTNTSNFTLVTSVDFDNMGLISSASIQAVMLEKNRIVKKPEGEPTFHVLYQMLAGIDSNLRKDLHLENLTDPNAYMTPLQRNEDRQKAVVRWAQIIHAMTLLKVTDEEQRAICSVLAAIYHLGVAGVAKAQTGKYQFARPSSAQFAANVLGTNVEELSRAIFNPTSSSSTSSLSPGYRAGGDKDLGGADSPASASGLESLEGFITGLYSDAFQALVNLINRALSSNYRNISSVRVIDAPGFRNPASCGRQCGATFEELCHNYVQERLQLLFHESVFTSEQELYAQEGIETDFDPVISSPAPIVQMLDQPHQGLMRSPGLNGGGEERKGLLWLLDEEALSPGSTDDSFLTELLDQYQYQSNQKGRVLLTKGTEKGTFVVHHFQGTSPVQYNVRGWLRACRENPISRYVTGLLQDSKRTEISSLFLTLVRPGMSGTISGSCVGIEAGASLRRASSRSFISSAASIKRRSVSIQVKLQTDSLIDLIRRSSVHFVHCLLPQPNAGLCDLRPVNMAASTGGGVEGEGGLEESMLSVPFVRTQMRGTEIIDAIRIHKQGYPEHMPFKEFRRRFDILVSGSSPRSAGLDDKEAMIPLLQALEIDQHSYKLGITQVFFRAGGLAQLEYTREEKVSGWVIGLQAVCRGYLGRRSREKSKLQHIAVSCVQKNVRKLMDIREWAWWRLYVKVKPLVNVHRTEEELKDREVELEQLKSKLEKAEKERQEYKLAVEKLEARLSDVAADYEDEHMTSTQAGELLEQETTERIRLEKELKDLQSRMSSLQKQNQRTEMELIDARMLAAAVDTQEIDDDDEADDSALRERYERLRREFEYSKKKMQQEHEEELEHYESSKKQLDRKLNESTLELEERERELSNLKRKTQRANQDMSDVKIHLEEQITRNNELEKKQRKFDSELSKMNETLRSEKSQREKLQRERDELAGLKYSLELAVKNLTMDVELEKEKSARLDRELSDMTGTVKDDSEVMKLKKLKLDLEHKVSEQEEELDEQAGTIQQLEQAKLRLEMAQEKLKQNHSKELEEKENDLTELKSTMQKKMKSLELQMEEDHDERQRLVREKRELERKIQQLGDQKPQRDREVELQLRRDLKRTKALLQDAQLMLAKYKEGAGNRNTIKQLRNQLEDAEFATAAAVKARKAVEMDLHDIQQQLDDTLKAKNDAEERCLVLGREKNDVTSRLEENEEELNEIMKKYKAAVQQHSVDLLTFQEQSRQIESLQNEREALKEEVSALQSRSSYLNTSAVDRESVTRLEVKIRDLETKLEFEQSSRHRAETQLSRLKDQLDGETEEKQTLKSEENRAQEQNKRLQRQIRELEEELADFKRKESESNQRKSDLDPEFNAPPGIGGTKKYRPPVGDFFLTLSRGFTADQPQYQPQYRPQDQPQLHASPQEPHSGSTTVSTAGSASENQERKLETMEGELEQSQNDLQLAFKRIADLQAVMEEDVDHVDGDSDLDSDYAGGAYNDDDDDDDDDDDRAIRNGDDSHA